MSAKLDYIFSLLTSGKYTGVQDEKDIDSVIRLIVLNMTYTISAVLIAGIGIKDMQNGLVNQGLLELIIGFLILLNLMLLRSELPLIVGGMIITTLFGCFCGIAFFTEHMPQGVGSLWIYSYPLMSIFTLGLPAGLIPALLLFVLTVSCTFIPNFTSVNYALSEAILICGVYFFILVLTVIYEYVRSIKDHWLSRQDSYMNMVFENSPDIILLLDKNNALVYCAEVFLKKSRIRYFAQIRKTHYSEVFSLFCEKNELEEIESLFEISREEKNPVVFEREMDIGRDGNLRHYEIHFTPMHNEYGVFQGAFILFHDMTEIIAAKKRTEQASLAKSNFLANMSHEIRTPLNAIIGMATIAENTDELARKDYCLARISGASNHLLGIINDILDMSKIEEGKLELSPTEFDFSAMLRRIVNIFEFRLSEKKQRLITTQDPLIPPQIFTDEQRLSQVITNLISNAIKFTPDEGEIRLDAKLLELGAENCVLELRVTDTGIGISKEQQGYLFQSFVQVDSSISRKFGGTGLGLAISKTIAKMMSGDIRIESELGKGASFIVTITAGIPKARAEAVDAAPKGNAAPEARGETFRGKRVLLAEDVDINREIVVALLEDFDIGITEAENGQQAFDAFAAAPEKYDLVFMDIHMPGINGYEATRLIRALDHPNAKTVPIIAMTANVFKEDIERCLEAGMNAHIGKPLDFKELTEVLKKYLPGETEGETPKPDA